MTRGKNHKIRSKGIKRKKAADHCALVSLHDFGEKWTHLPSNRKLSQGHLLPFPECLGLFAFFQHITTQRVNKSRHRLVGTASRKKKRRTLLGSFKGLGNRSFIVFGIVLGAALLGFFGYRGMRYFEKKGILEPYGLASQFPIVAMATPGKEVIMFESVATKKAVSGPTLASVVATDSFSKSTQCISCCDTDSQELRVYCISKRYVPDPCSSELQICAPMEVAPCVLMPTLRHVAGRGVGFDEGYTSMEQLLFPFRSHGDLWPFLDLRIHGFNNGDLAANVGAGIRYYSQCTRRAYGVNTYFDFQETSHRSRFSQFGIGFEILSGCWDLRVNGYLPFRETKLLKKCHWDYPGGYWIERKKYAEARRGLDLELGAKLFSMNLFRSCRTNCGTCLTVYGAAGPYYYHGEVTHFVGAQGRLKLDFGRYVSLEGRITRDSFYKTRVNGIFSIHFPLGCTACDKDAERVLSQPVRRNEIIDISRYCKWKWNY